MQLIRVRVLTRILKEEVTESIPGKKLGAKAEKLEFDPENLAENWHETLSSTDSVSP